MSFYETERDNRLIDALKDISKAIRELKAREVIVSVLERQIPKKPLANLAKDYEGNIFDVTYSCPVCSRTICYEAEGNLAKNYPYCNCGQALDWGDTE